jgi:hypothetical protein
MEDLLTFLITLTLLFVSLHSPLPERRVFLLALALFAFGQFLDTLDELRFLDGVFILGRGGRFHEIAEDGIGRLVGFFFLLLWVLRIRGSRKGGIQKKVSWNERYEL